jgi:hypothetical protein
LAGSPYWTNYTFHTIIQNVGNTRAVGVYVLYQNDENYVRFAMSRAHSCYALVLVVDGVASFLKQTSSTPGYGWVYALSISVLHRRVRVWVDSVLVMEAALPSNAPVRGRVGTLVYKNNALQFTGSEVVFGDAGDGRGEGPGLDWTLGHGPQRVGVSVRGASASFKLPPNNASASLSALNGTNSSATGSNNSAAWLKSAFHFSRADTPAVTSLHPSVGLAGTVVSANLSQAGRAWSSLEVPSGLPQQAMHFLWPNRTIRVWVGARPAEVVDWTSNIVQFKVPPGSSGLHEVNIWVRGVGFAHFGPGVSRHFTLGLHLDAAAEVPLGSLSGGEGFTHPLTDGFLCVLCLDNCA